MRFSLAALCLWVVLTPVLRALDLQIDNQFGGVFVHISMEGRLQLELLNKQRPALQSDLKVTRTNETMVVVSQPGDGAAFDINVTVPFGSSVDIRTKDGKISLDGYPALFVAQTVSGEIELKAPWEATLLRFVSRSEPKNVVLPEGHRFRVGKGSELGEKRWVIEDRFKEDYATYGNVRIRSQNTNRVRIEAMPLPENAPVKMHWEAAQAYEALVSGGSARGTSATPVKSKSVTAAASSMVPSDEVVFSSDVRMVSLQVAVHDKQGTPLAGLGPQDFQIYENGVLQKIASVESEQTPFNLALLFDLSSSTQRNRNQMKQVASRFLSVARPHDKVAAYVLANNWFGIISRLTADREELARRIDDLPDLSGGSPLYDAMVLAYSEELGQRPDERNALVVISDGIDNRLYGIGQPSNVSFTDLKRAASHMNALLYPVFLGPSEDQLQKGSRPYEAYMRFIETAAESGGRVFSAATLEEFDNVYEGIAEDLRSVYSVSYYPANQEFNGEFRSVEVRVSRRDATARTRPGYTAR